jgi:hypothetical protein
VILLHPGHKQRVRADVKYAPFLGDGDGGGGARICTLDIVVEEVSREQRDDLHAPQQMVGSGELDGDEVPKVDEAIGLPTGKDRNRGRVGQKVGDGGSHRGGRWHDLGPN